MTHDELREKVAAAMRPHADYEDFWDKTLTLQMADAAIALVLEEAARVAENNEGKARWQGEHIAAAIRSLIPKAPESPEQS